MDPDDKARQLPQKKKKKTKFKWIYDNIFFYCVMSVQILTLIGYTQFLFSVKWHAWFFL